MVMYEPEKTKDFEEARQEFLEEKITITEFLKRAYKEK